MTIVFGTDFSLAADRALAAAGAIASRLGEELVLAHATDSRGVESENRIAELTGLLRSRAGALSARLPGSTVSTEVVEGSAHRAIVKLAAERGASILIVASEGHGATSLVHLGGTSERIASSAPCPTLVVRSPDLFVEWGSGARSLRIVLGIGEASTTDRAIAFVRRLCEAGPCDVVATHVYYPHDAAKRYGLDHYLGFIERDPELERLVARDIAERVGTLGGTGTFVARPKIGVGRLADHLLEVAELERADLVVVGTRGSHGPLARLRAVSSGALHFGRMAVACVPSSTTPGAEADQIPSIRRVLIPVDRTASFHAAIASGYGMIQPRGEATLLYVTKAAMSPEERAAITSELRALVPKDAAALATTRIEIVTADDPVPEILAAAERLGVDAVCVGAHAAGPSRAALGTVARRVVTECARPVMVVHPRAEED